MSKFVCPDCGEPVKYRLHKSTVTEDSIDPVTGKVIQDDAEDSNHDFSLMCSECGWYVETYDENNLPDWYKDLNLDQKRW